jgi:hypothetical protein
VGLAVAAIYLGAEEWLTGGLMSYSVITLPREIRHITAGSWGHVGSVFAVTARRGLGIILLGVAVAVTHVRARWLRRLDLTLIVFIAAETALMVNLCLASSGAWYNYAVPAVLYTSILVGRALDSLLVHGVTRWERLAVGIASAGLFVLVTRTVMITAESRRRGHEDIAALLADPRVSSHASVERYFAGPLQHLNQRFGNRQSLHDEWLYTAFEAVHAAEPRQVWLQQKLVRGPISQVIVPGHGIELSGITGTLPELGYTPVRSFGELRLWARESAGLPTPLNNSDCKR